MRKMKVTAKNVKIRGLVSKQTPSDFPIEVLEKEDCEPTFLIWICSVFCRLYLSGGGLGISDSG